MPIFKFYVVGSGGGIDETDLSAYFFKPSGTAIEDGLIGLEAGSGHGTLAKLLRANPDWLGLKTPHEVYSIVKSFLLSHAHADHVSASVLAAGAMAGTRKKLYATKGTLDQLERGIFNDEIWPDLASWKENDEQIKYLYSALSLGKYQPIFPSISVQPCPLSHGTNAKGEYESTAFFIRHDPSGHEFLFFGDVEPDSVTARRPGRNSDVWRKAAPKVPETLNTIFIECSWPLGRPDAHLFGHLTPAHLCDELTVLAEEVVRARRLREHDRDTAAKGGRKRKRPKKAPPETLTPEDVRGSLVGVRVYVIHCKDPMDWKIENIKQFIAGQVRQLVDERGLGLEVIPAEQGMTIEI